MALEQPVSTTIDQTTIFGQLRQMGIIISEIHKMLYGENPEKQDAKATKHSIATISGIIIELNQRVVEIKEAIKMIGK